jgi:CSLREA domain-containing protein
MMKLSRVFFTGIVGIALLLALSGLLGGSPLVRAAGFSVDVTNDENDGSCDPGDCSLREAIIAANGNGEADTITVGSGTYILSLVGQDEDDGATGDLDITAPLTITGAGPTETIIDANGIDRVFDIETGVATVVISGVTIINGNANFSGGGIYNYDTDLTLINTVVVSNAAVNYGGGVFSSRGTLTVEDTQVLSNTAKRGGGIHVNYDPGSLTLTGDSLVAYNRSIGSSMDGAGAGIYLGSSSALLESGQIFSNTAGSYGGGVYASSGGVTLTGVLISGNAAFYGGGVHLRDSGSNLTLVGGEISSNTATLSGGGVYVFYGAATLHSGQIVNNTAFEGGGVHISYGNVTLDGAQITNNEAERGGGVYVAQSTGAFTQTDNATIAYNHATGTGTNDGGGGVYINHGTVVLEDGDIVSNTAGNGAGIFTADVNSVLTQTGDSIIAYNTAVTDGGGVYVYYGSVALQGGQILDNAASDGGGVYVQYGDVTLDGVDITDNLAERGGGLYIYQTDVTLSGGQINSNEADDGGGVYVQNSAATLIQTSDAMISRNTAVNGGGVYLASGNAALFDSRITYNDADYGGGLYLSETDAELTVSWGAINNNTAFDGGGVYINNGSAVIHAAWVTRNTANWSGGGLYVVDGSTTVSQTVIASNNADSGGGVFRDGGGSLDLVNTTISQNEADHGSGGGLRNDSGVTNLTFVTVVSNTATAGAGGIQLGSGLVYLEDTILAYNGTNCNTGLSSQGYNIEDANTCGLGGSDFVNTDPLVGPLSDNGGDTLTHALLNGSPAIDSGTCVLGIDTDQRGFLRPYGDDCDIGAFELHTVYVYLPLIVRE